MCKIKNRVCRKFLAVILLISLCLSLLSGCKKAETIGPVVNEAGLVYLSPESPAGETAIGIVYRQVMDFEAFLAHSDLPVLVLVSSRSDRLDSAAMLLLEQLAYEYRDRLACMRVEQDDYPEIADFCGAGTVPCYALTDKGALVRTTGGLETVERTSVVAMLQGIGAPSS